MCLIFSSRDNAELLLGTSGYDGVILRWSTGAKEIKDCFGNLHAKHAGVFPSLAENMTLNSTVSDFFFHADAHSISAMKYFCLFKILFWIDTACFWKVGGPNWLTWRNWPWPSPCKDKKRHTYTHTDKKAKKKKKEKTTPLSHKLSLSPLHRCEHKRNAG